MKSEYPKYNWTHHIVFIPKYRRKVMYGEIGKEVSEILSTVWKITGVQLINGGVCSNHVHLYVSIIPMMSISDVMSKLKGKKCDNDIWQTSRVPWLIWEAFLVERILCRNNRAGEWEIIKKYIEGQEECSKIEGQSASFKRLPSARG